MGLCGLSHYSKIKDGDAVDYDEKYFKKASELLTNRRSKMQQCSEVIAHLALRALESLKDMTNVMK